MYYPCSENKGADQLCSYREADLHLCSHYADCSFYYAMAHKVDSRSIPTSGTIFVMNIGHKYFLAR